MCFARTSSSASYTIDNHLDRVLIESGLERLSTVESDSAKIYQYVTPVCEIAQRLGYSRRHITRLHRGALQKLKPYARPISA